GVERARPGLAPDGSPEPLHSMELAPECPFSRARLPLCCVVTSARATRVRCDAAKGRRGDGLSAAVDREAGAGPHPGERRRGPPCDPAPAAASPSATAGGGRRQSRLSVGDKLERATV